MTTNITNLNKVRDAKDAKLYQIAQAQKIIDLFETANGRPASTMEELNEWVGSPEGRATLDAHRNENGTINP